MASIFTFDPDPPRVSSPWSAPFSPIAQLEPEPQEGPVEYKLHLLLRPRRLYSATSTRTFSSRSSESAFATSSPLAHSNASRQHRLEQLTTQLLWRLQQSSPFHSSSANSVILPTLPEASTELHVPEQPSKLIPGLEESKGALYEIGVADDGTLAGLTKDEMNESLNNLRAMAASLGCTVDILKTVVVGTCEWIEEHGAEAVVRIGQLSVIEAYVKPALRKPNCQQENLTHASLYEKSVQQSVAKTVSGITKSIVPPREQIRVSLTGATTSGKSSLLGTLSTSTLDNGRGKSRLSLLKHRHEIASGMTSSVAQELIGYHDLLQNGQTVTQVINYASDNVSSWNDIHACSEAEEIIADSNNIHSQHCRLAFLSDSAGHPRYRRTTARGLVSWVPHWIMLCIAANDGTELFSGDDGTPPRPDSPIFAGASAHLSMAHLDLCLKLRLPLVVVFTKLDLAARSSFRQILSTLLSFLKEAGRRPLMLANNHVDVQETDLRTISDSDTAEVRKVIGMLEGHSHDIVPILFTSAVNGTGIGKLHGLLSHLPILPPEGQLENVYGLCSKLRVDDASESHLQNIFNIDEVYTRNVSKAHAANDLSRASEGGHVVSGRVAHGRITIGDQILLGPFSHGTGPGSDNSANPSFGDVKDAFLQPRSFDDALMKATSSPKARIVPISLEWHRVKVVSIRNLRLPVSVLEADQVGTIGVLPLDHNPSSGPLTIRKGMILADGVPTAAHTFTGFFDVADAGSFTVGSHVVVYCASVRAPAKVVAIALHADGRPRRTSASDLPEELEAEKDDFDLASDEDVDDDIDPSTDVKDSIRVTFQFTTYREWIEIGAKVLVMPGGGPGLRGSVERGVKGVGGLDGFVGRVLQTF